MIYLTCKADTDVMDDLYHPPIASHLYCWKCLEPPKKPDPSVRVPVVKGTSLEVPKNQV